MIFLQIRLKNTCTKIFWITAALIPIMIIGLSLIFGYSSGLAIQVGIYGNTTINGGDDITIINYDNLENLHRDVANRRLELAYVISNENPPTVTVYTSPVTLTERVVNLLLAATLLEPRTGEVGAESLPFDADAAAIQARVNEFLADGVLMERNVISINETATPTVPFRRLFHGLLALFAQLTAMLCATEFTKQKIIANRIKIISNRKYVSYTLAGWLAIFMLTATIMSTAILPVALLLPGVWIFSDFYIFTLYMLIISGLTLLLTKLPQAAYSSVLVVGFIFTALMGGIIFDLREMLQEFAFLRLIFPSTYYMELLNL
ncbi:MAG: hypothetical protein FWG64_14835 [Firmicutes bacterium]|nr:hypothetical protein [Bacillota bacterium]